MNECYRCGFWDSEREGCTCSSDERWYACPIESEKPENKKALEEYAEWAGEENKRQGIAYNLARVMQCIECKNDPEYCGCTDDDEDEDGFCKKWEERK